MLTVDQKRVLLESIRLFMLVDETVAVESHGYSWNIEIYCIAKEITLRNKKIAKTLRFLRQTINFSNHPPIPPAQVRQRLFYQDVTF